MDGSFTLPRDASTSDPLRIAVMISGGGSGLASILSYESFGSRFFRTVLVLADSNEAGGLGHARKAGIDSIGIPLPEIGNKKEQRLKHEELIHEQLKEYNTELIILAGYMRIFTPVFVSKWKGRLINIHPSLLPKYPGAHAHRDALADGAVISGCTVHFVDEGVDTGRIIAQSEVPVLTGDSIGDLQERVKMAEHALYPRTIDAIAENPSLFIDRQDC